MIRKTATCFSPRQKNDCPMTGARKTNDAPFHQKNDAELVSSSPYPGYQLQVLYQGGSYATAKANEGCSPAGNDLEEETRPGEGEIVKTVEVDVESTSDRPPSVRFL